MRVIVVANKKGGVGKTTTSLHLAVAAEQAGDGPAVLLDCDPQGSLAESWNAREAEQPAFLATTVEELPQRLQALRKARVQLVVIDTPPQAGDLVREVLKHADLVVIPVKPGPLEMRAIGSTVDLADETGARMVFVLAIAKKRARLTGQTAVALSQHGTVSPVTLHDRVDFGMAMIDGRAAQEYAPDGDAAQEAAELWKYVNKQLRRGARS